MEKRELQIFRKYLERRGLKLTHERQALFDELFSRHEHVEADELLVRLRAKHKKISRATIYRTLELMVDAGHRRPPAHRGGRVPLRAAARRRPPRPPDLRPVRPRHRVLRAPHRAAPGRGRRAPRVRAALPHAPDAGDLPVLPPARESPPRPRPRGAEPGRASCRLLPDHADEAAPQAQYCVSAKGFFVTIR